MKIKINNKTIELKQTFRTLMLYENIANETFIGNKSITSVLLYFFCNILASMENPDLTFDEFLDYIDKDSTVLEKYTTWLNKQTQIQNSVKPESKETGEKKTE